MAKEISKEELQELYEEKGWSMRKCGDYFDVSHKTIQRRLEKYDIPKRSKGRKITTDSRTCSRCKITKPLEKFSKNSSTATGRSWLCYECSREKGRENSYKKHGITKEEYEEILNKQGGMCAICGRLSPHNKRNDRFIIDHDHSTGEVRGLLCMKCNTGLGMFEDNIENLEGAIEYLKENN